MTEVRWFFKNQKPVKKPVKSACDTYLRVIQGEQNQKHLVIANQVRIFEAKHLGQQNLEKLKLIEWLFLAGVMPLAYNNTAK
ncbi:MAG: hypothetical protein ACTMIS_08390 [Pseudomonas putida]|uniref:Uncharacterized protein n=1 Tax=Pseudomonas juntendi TaxID=2666183 RepID=A0A7W2LQ28_9PSED|nr:hypothetical protein [Pseudomonas juntendi]MBA6144968.1 hypothetical protein [Pseudomonas juntendi]